MKPAVRYAIVAIACVLVGALGGGYFAWRWAITKWVPVTDLFTVVQASTWTAASRDSGDPSAYEDALRAYLAVVDTAIERDSTGVNRRMYLGDKALGLVRLADVVEKRGAQGDSVTLRQQAAALCPVYGLADCNAESLSVLAKKLDQVFTGGKQ